MEAPADRPSRTPSPPDLLDRVVCADNLTWMAGLPDGLCDLIYIDPPYMTGQFRGQASGHRFDDRWAGGLDAYRAFLGPRLAQMHRLLAPCGTLYVHIDPRVSHHVRLLLDDVFEARNFLNEIVWSYRTGGCARQWFARKHDTVLAYAKQIGQHTFNQQRGGTFRTDGLKRDAAGRPFKETRRGRLYFSADGPVLTDVWDIPFLSTVARERTGYPTQKPLALLERIIRASSNPGDVVADFFCGSGTTLAAAKALGRHFLGCDVSPEAVEITRKRLGAGQQ